MAINCGTWKFGGGSTCTVNFESCGCDEKPESAEDRVKRLKAEYDEVLSDKQEVEKQLREAQAKLAAEQAEKNKTYGQKVAEEVANTDIKHGALGVHGPVLNIGGWWFVPAVESDDKEGNYRSARRSLAAALDKAYADGAAEQRKKIAARCRDFQAISANVYAAQYAYGYVAKLAEGSDFNI